MPRDRGKPAPDDGNALASAVRGGALISVTLVAAVVGVLALERVPIRIPSSRIDGLEELLRVSRGLVAARARANDASLDVAFFGDSTAFGGRGVDRAIHTLLGYELRRTVAPRKVRVHAFAQAGVDSFGYALAAPRTAEAGPDVAVMAVNLSWFAPGWRERIRRPELGGLFRLRAMPAFFALSPSWNGLTLDVGLRNWLLVKLRALDLWRALDRAQVKLVRMRGALERTL